MNPHKLKQKEVCQLDGDNYFIGVSIAYESPLELGTYLIPAGSVDAQPPELFEGKRARWSNKWVYDDLPEPEIVVADINTSDNQVSPTLDTAELQLSVILRAKDLLLITDKYDQIPAKIYIADDDNDGVKLRQPEESLNELQIWRKHLLGIALELTNDSIVEAPNIIESIDLLESIARFELPIYKEFMSNSERIEFLDWKNKLLNCILGNEPPIKTPKFMQKFLEL